METFAEPWEFEKNPRYLQDREEALASLDYRDVDQPIAELIKDYNALPQCFTVQCCYGHFICGPGQNPHNLDRLPPRYAGHVYYRIAYIAFCLEDSERGRELRKSLALVPAFDPDYVQFGSAEWFRERYCNFYALQVEPARHMTRDQCVVELPEALHIEITRDLFFTKLAEVLKRHLNEHRADR